MKEVRTDIFIYKFCQEAVLKTITRIENPEIVSSCKLQERKKKPPKRLAEAISDHLVGGGAENKLSGEPQTLLI